MSNPRAPRAPQPAFHHQLTELLEAIYCYDRALRRAGGPAGPRKGKEAVDAAVDKIRPAVRSLFEESENTDDTPAATP